MNTFDEILDGIFDIHDDSDGIEISDFVDKKNEAVKKYAKAWKHFADDDFDTDNIDVSKHMSFLRAIRDISVMAEEYGLSAKVISDDYATDAISEYISNQFCDLVDMADNHYDWPYNHMEFDADSAIQEKLDEAERIELGNNVYYYIPDIADYL